MPFNFKSAVIVCSDFGAQENKTCHSFHFIPFLLAWNDETSCHDFSFLNVEFQASFFSLSSFTLIKRFFSSSSLSAIRVVLSAYLRLLIFLPEILILACDLSSLAFHMMYSACKLNKQGDNIQPWRTPFPIWNQSAVSYSVLWPSFSLAFHMMFSA